jgi:hypothetical protein
VWLRRCWYITSSSGSLCSSKGPSLSANLGTSDATPATPIEDLVDNVLVIATEALACGLTQVATVAVATGSDHYGAWNRVLADVSGDRRVHFMSHGENGGWLNVSKICDFVSGRIALAADRLETATESGKSVLSNSAIVWQGANGGLHHHPGQH